MRLAPLACLTVLLLAFAGCSGKGSGSGASSSTSHSTPASHSSSPSSSPSSSSSSPSSSSSSSPSSANHPPTGAVSVTVNGTKATFNLTGSDPDQDTLAWDLSFGDGNKTNGTSLPATVSHNYTKAGNLTAQYTVTDGKSPTAYNVTVHLAASAAGGSQSVSGSTTASTAACPQDTADFAHSINPAAPRPFDPYPGQASPAEGVEWIKFTLNPGVAGQHYSGTGSFTVPVVFGDALDFYDASGKQVDSQFSSNGAYDGTVPANAAFAVAYPCGPGPYSFTFTSP